MDDSDEEYEEEGSSRRDDEQRTPQNENTTALVIGAKQILASPTIDLDAKGAASSSKDSFPCQENSVAMAGSILGQVAGDTDDVTLIPNRALDSLHHQATVIHDPPEEANDTSSYSSDEANCATDIPGEAAPVLFDEGASPPAVKRKRGRPKGSKNKNSMANKKPKTSNKRICRQFADPDVQRRLEEYRRKKNERSRKYRLQQKMIEEAKAAGKEIPVFRQERSYENDPLAAIPDFHCKDGMVWEVEDIPLTVATSLTDDTPKIINFADTIGCIDGKKMRWVDGQEKLYLPSEYNQNNPEWRRTVLGKAFNQACMLAGTKVIMYGWEPLKLNAKFGCYRCRRRSSAEPRSKSLKPTIHSDLCRFSFHVYWDDAVNRWYVKKLGAGCKIHSGHEPILNLQEFRKKSRERIRSRLEELPVGSALQNRLARRGLPTQKSKSNKQAAEKAKAQSQPQNERDSGNQQYTSDVAELSEDSAPPIYDCASVVDVTQTYRQLAPVAGSINDGTVNGLECVPDNAASAIVAPYKPARGPAYAMTHDLFADVTTLISEPSDAIHLRKMLLDFKEYMEKKVEAQRGPPKADEDRSALRSTQNGYIYYHV